MGDRELGRRWTTRVIVLPGSPPIVEGRTVSLRHPNYLIVALEIAVVPLALGLPLLGAGVFRSLNAALLYFRIPSRTPRLAWAEGRAR